MHSLRLTFTLVRARQPNDRIEWKCPWKSGIKERESGAGADKTMDKTTQPTEKLRVEYAIESHMRTHEE